MAHGQQSHLYGLWRLERSGRLGGSCWSRARATRRRSGTTASRLWVYPAPETWKEEWADHLEGIEKIYAVIEPDKGGAP